MQLDIVNEENATVDVYEEEVDGEHSPLVEEADAYVLLLAEVLAIVFERDVGENEGMGTTVVISAELVEEEVVLENFSDVVEGAGGTSLLDVAADVTKVVLEEVAEGVEVLLLEDCAEYDELVLALVVAGSCTSIVTVGALTSMIE